MYCMRNVQINCMQVQYCSTKTYFLEGFSNTIPGYSGTIFRGTGDNVENLNNILIQDHVIDEDDIPLVQFRRSPPTTPSPDLA